MKTHGQTSSSTGSSPLIIPRLFPWLWCRYKVDKNNGNLRSPKSENEAFGYLESLSYPRSVPALVGSVPL